MTAPASNGSLPKGWRSVRFGEVVRDVNEAERNPLDAGLERFVGLEHIEPENLHLNQWGMLADGKISFTKRFRKGQVLFGKRRAYQRKVAVAEFDGICSSDILTFEPKGDALIPELLPFIVQSDGFFEHALGTSSGSLSPRTRWSQLQDYEFPLPPTAEQRRIADILWAADVSARNFSDAAEKGQLFRRKLMISLYQTGIGHSLFRQTELGRIPANWEVCSLDRYYQVQLGKKLNPAARAGENHRPYLRNANVKWNEFDLSDILTMSFSDIEFEKYKLRSGDILACEGRHVGKSAMWQGEIEDVCFQMTLHRLRARNESQEPRFLLHYMQVQSWLGRFGVGTGETTIPHLTAEQLKQIRFAFPPLDEQRQIADIVESVSSAVRALETHAMRLRSLRCKLFERLILGWRDVH